MTQAFPPPQLLQDPYPFHRMLRSNNPVFRVPVCDADSPGLWILTHHRDVQSVLSAIGSANPHRANDRPRGETRTARIRFCADW